MREASAQFDHSNIEVVRKCPLGDDARFSPELAVITRTQGKRNSALEEMLLGLAAQTDMRFIVHIAGHNLGDAQKKELLTVIETCPSWIRDRISLINVTGGGRSHPLNAALACIRAPYFSILDDDDVIFDIWAEAFIATAQEHPGKIIHSGVFVQKWDLITQNGEIIERAASSPTFEYCKPFNTMRQYQDNFCPVMGLAYPSFIVKQLGLRFDDSLSTLEDWDFLMRASALCGVQESGQNTSIYRIWKNTGTSHDLHDEHEWEQNRLRVKEKLNARPLLFPPGSVNQLADLVKTDSEVQLPTNYARMLVAYVNGAYTFAFPSCIKYDEASHVNSIVFDIPRNCAVERLALRPVDFGQITILDFSVSLDYVDGSREVLNRNDVIGNGYNPSAREWAFIDPPEISILMGKRSEAQTCTWSFKYKNAVSRDVLVGTKIPMRIKSSLRRKLHRVRKRFGRR